MTLLRSIVTHVMPITCSGIVFLAGYSFAINWWDIPPNEFFLFLVFVMVPAFYLGYWDRHLNPDSSVPRKRTRYAEDHQKTVPVRLRRSSQDVR